MLQNFLDRSEQKTCACLSPNRKTCHKGAHFILKITDNINIPVGLAVRICGGYPQGPGSTPGLVNLLIFQMIFSSY